MRPGGWKRRPWLSLAGPGWVPVQAVAPQCVDVGLSLYSNGAPPRFGNRHHAVSPWLPRLRGRGGGAGRGGQIRAIRGHYKKALRVPGTAEARKAAAVAEKQQQGADRAGGVTRKQEQKRRPRRGLGLNGRRASIVGVQLGSATVRPPPARRSGTVQAARPGRRQGGSAGCPRARPGEARRHRGLRRLQAGWASTEPEQEMRLGPLTLPKFHAVTN